MSVDVDRVPVRLQGITQSDVLLPQSDAEDSCISGVVRPTVISTSKKSRENRFQISKNPYYSSSDDEAISSDAGHSSVEDAEYDWGETPAVDDGNILRDGLAKWALEFNVTHTAVDALLSLLRDNGLETLPKSATSLLGTVHCVSKDFKQLGSGLYWYRGVKKYLETYFTPEMACVVDGQKSVKLDIFVDGLSPYKAPTKKAELWPIAGRIVCAGFKTKPFVIALWCGPKKVPDSLEEFLIPFVTECKELMKGFVLKGTTYMLVLRHVIGDAPARAWLKQVKQHGSKASCERCNIRGIWLSNRVVFDPNSLGELRTNESFTNRTDGEYHLADRSPLEEIVHDMILQFPLDRLHLLDLGAVRRIIKFLLEPKASSIKLKPALIARLDWFMSKLLPFFPSEFRRKPKSICDFRIYKGSEFKRILQYDGILVFYFLTMNAKEYEGVYQCFLMLSCAARILSDEDLCHQYVGDARQLLKGFVNYSESVFGDHFVVYNIHHLLHLADDCGIHGVLDGFSAELYESYLGRMKRWLRAPGRTITQIVARTLEHEKNHTTERYLRNFNEARLTMPNESGCSDGLCGEMYSKFETDDFAIVASLPVHTDNCCITKSGEVIIVQNIVKVGEIIYFVGKQFEEKTSFFDYPMDSSLLEIHKVQKLSAKLSHWSVKTELLKSVY